MRSIIYTLALTIASISAQASGPLPPSKAQHDYSFSCPSGASGRLSYAENTADKQFSQLKLWVNGNYIQAEPKVASALQGKNIVQLRGGCEGEKTTVLAQVSDPNAPADSQLNWVTVLVDRTGRVIWVGV